MKTKTIEDLTPSHWDDLQGRRPQAYTERFSEKIFTKGKTINDLNKKYDLELEKVISKIKSAKAKLVLLQFPDGLKPYATAVVDYLEEKLNFFAERKNKIKFLIWLGDCFGACDTPVLGKDLEKQIDLVIQFGHNQMMPSY